ncbi:hypothetical protein OE88DRAFT_1508222 [Heliocybe sulcata]|uniref:Uncharacterized protein n=1 Tax=Heliocybe sulcata TaxID=5364 RepID=A0A5C3N310_9AGAM|nr:hypothetical protein OE88DRAFT_1508222 [Heliocybe sulcata]
MGPGLRKTRVDDSQLTALLDAKDTQIARLELESRAFAARASHLRTRLLATLDTLDSQHLHHRHELSDFEHKLTSLRAKLSKAVARAREAEAERDDMREAVVELVEKVEKSSDCSLWPHSRIRMTSPAEPSSTHPAIHYPPVTDLQTYAASLLASLHAERTSHSLTQRRISLLEAQLARRDAELEACLHHADHRERIRADEKRHTGGRGGEASMTDEEVLEVLEAAAARNRALEVEVQHIAARVSYFPSLPLSLALIRDTCVVSYCTQCSLSFSSSSRPLASTPVPHNSSH